MMGIIIRLHTKWVKKYGDVGDPTQGLMHVKEVLY
jgi:hypothetical protein